MHKRRMTHEREGSCAVIYIRVSTDEQAVGALNLENQESRCREYCLRQVWQVDKVFTDSGESARTLDRPEFQRMLAYCRTNRRQIGYVVVQDLSRFARNAGDQAETIAELRRIGVLLRSTYESNIDETAAGTMAANLFGAFNQYFSDALSEKMRDRTRQSVAAGRFPWRAPIGFQNIGGKEGPNIVPDERAAPLVRRAFELMATGRYKKTAVLAIISDEGLRTARGKPLSPQTFHKLLQNPLYAGWVTLTSDKTFERVRGLHAPLVSQQLFDDVQAVLAGRSPGAPAKRKLNPDFPLKHFVKCDSCGVPLTGGLCTGRSKRYPHYWCRNPDCRKVKLSGERLEAEFLALLRSLRLTVDDASQIPKLAAKVWSAGQRDEQKEVRRLEARLAEQKRLKRKLLDSMFEGTISNATYKETEEEFRVEIAATENALRDLDDRQLTQDAFLRFAKLHMANIAGAWQAATAEQKHRVQNLLFEDGLFYSEKTGILNRSKSCLFSVVEGFGREELSLASPTGFEPVLSP
jgi:site-specific DNA recombinase